MMAALANASQNSTTSRRRSVHQRSLPYWLPRGVGALDHPAATRLDRGWQPTGGDRTDHAPFGQDLAAGLIVVAGVQVHDGLGGQRPDHLQGVQGGRQQPVACAGWPGPAPPPAGCRPLDGDRAFQPLLRRSTGLGPAVWPPQGALVVQPSTASCSSSKPNSWS